MYTSTKRVGEAFANVSRKDLYLTSKVKGLPYGTFEELKSRVLKMLRDAGAGTYFDLLLVHWPGPAEYAFGPTPDAFAAACDEAFEKHIERSWRNMIRLKEIGLVREIGVSNFYQKHMSILLPLCEDRGLPKPFANEIYIDACHQRETFVRSLQKEGIRVFAYRSVAFATGYAMLKDAGLPVASELDALVEKSESASIHQFIIAALLRRDIHVVVRSSSSARQASNLKALDVAKTIDNETMRSFGALGARHGETVDMYGLADEWAGALATPSFATK